MKTYTNTMKLETYTDTQSNVTTVAALLLDRCCWFQITPLPDDLCEVATKAEGHLLYVGVHPVKVLTRDTGNPSPGTQTYTVFVFVREGDNSGTTFISSATAATQEDAVSAVVEECRECWDGYLGELHVLGVAAGDVEILDWDDLI